MRKAKTNTETVDILEIEQGQITFCVLGKTPLVHNRMSEKVMRELLLPAGPKNKVDRALKLKHAVDDEFRASPYTLSDDNAPTLICHLSEAFRKAVLSAVLVMPGAVKTSMTKLLNVEGNRIPVYGRPYLFMDVVRQAGPARTPDVRTRAIQPRWACEVTLTYTKPILAEKNVANLFAAAGHFIGIGDKRNEKGAGNHGLWTLVSPDDPEYLSVLKEGRACQVEAMRNPIDFDNDTADLRAWYHETLRERGLSSSKRARNGAAQEASA